MSESDKKKCDRIKVSIRPLEGGTFKALCKERNVPMTQVIDEMITRSNAGKPFKSTKEAVDWCYNRNLSNRLDTKRDHAAASKLRAKGWKCEPPSSLEEFYEEN